jgi:hypothetical protein
VAVDAPAGLGAGRERARAREVLPTLADRRGQDDAVPTDPLQRRGEGAGPALGPGGDRDLATALHVEQGDEVHVHPDGDGCVAAGEAARRHDQVVRRRDAEPAELDGDRRREVAGPLECFDRLERVRAVTVVVGRAGGEPPGELLGERHETRAGFRMSCQFDRHDAAQ